MYDQRKNEIELAAKVMLHGWPALKAMLIHAYSYGYESGYHDTVEGRFCVCEKADEHFAEVEEWVDDNLEIFK